MQQFLRQNYILSKGLKYLLNWYFNDKQSDNINTHAWTSHFDIDIKLKV